MAYGEDLPPSKTNKSPKRPVRKEEDEPDVDRFDELQKEVEDRQRFLNEMESLGQGDKYGTIIRTEISQLVREMEIIDRKRTAELQKMIDADNKKREKLHAGAIPGMEDS